MAGQARDSLGQRQRRHRGDAAAQRREVSASMAREWVVVLYGSPSVGGLSLALAGDFFCLIFDKCLHHSVTYV